MMGKLKAKPLEGPQGSGPPGTTRDTTSRPSSPALDVHAASGDPPDKLDLILQEIKATRTALET